MIFFFDISFESLSKELNVKTLSDFNIYDMCSFNDSKETTNMLSFKLRIEFLRFVFVKMNPP